MSASGMTKKIVMLSAAHAQLLHAVPSTQLQQGSTDLENAVSATLSPLFFFQGSNPHGGDMIQGATRAPKDHSWDDAWWGEFDGDLTEKNDGRSQLFLRAICAANGGHRWEVGTTDRDPAERWAGKKTQWKDNKTWGKLYDKMMRKPGQAWKDKIFSSGNVDDNANNGKGDGELRKKEGDHTRTKLNHPKNANSIDLSTDLQGAMEDSLIWQYKNLHRPAALHPWTSAEYRKAVRNSQANEPLYQSFYSLMAKWENVWTVYQLVVNPRPNYRSQSDAPCSWKSYNPSDEQFKTHHAHRPFSPANMPDAELLHKFQTELNKRDGVEGRVGGVWEGGFNAARYVARATLDLSRGEKCLRKDVEAADQYLRSGGFDTAAMTTFWKSLQKLASTHNDNDDHLGWLVDLAGQNKLNPATGSKKGEEAVEQCPPEKKEEEKKKNDEEQPASWGTGCIVLIAFGSLATVLGVVALCLILCTAQSSDDAISSSA